jgi:Domain of unknown function (DUF4105)
MAAEARHVGIAAGRRPALALLMTWLLVWLSLAALPAAAQIRIGVATMAPGEIFFERFGHNAIVVDDPALPEPVSYNFGYFDMGEDGFISRFVVGEMRYMLVALPWREDMILYERSGRGVNMQWLNLNQDQAQALASALAENAKPENARYRYDYYTDNCATRVRDAIDRALGGELRKQLRVRSQGDTYRSESVRLASPAWWMWLGFDLGLGPAADVPLSRWEDGFIPMRLAEGFRDVRLPDGRPLVASEQTILPHRVAPEPSEFRLIWWQWFFAGLAVAIAWFWLNRARPRIAATFALVFWTACALLGSTMLAIWLGTDHRFGWANQNLLIFSPLCWLTLPGAWRHVRGREPGRLFPLLLAAVTLSAVLAPFASWVQNAPQANAHWIALMLPIHIALAAAWLRWNVSDR